MSGRRLPAPAGHGVDRGRPLGFTFDDRAYEGLAGDILASALLANGVDVVARSPLLGRPRGVFSAGVEEPNAFVEIAEPVFRPIVPATAVPLVDGLVASARPGVGRLPAHEVPAPVARHRHVHVETLVVGGGIAGLRAALEAAEAGGRVMLVDERSWLGGTATTHDDIEGEGALPWITTTGGALASASDVTVLSDATALGVYDDGYVVVQERSTPIERLHHVRAGRVVLATGAHERPIGFARNDLPGVMLASAALLYVDRFGVLPGERAVVFSTNHAGHEAAIALAGAGLEIAAIVDPGGGGRAAGDARAAGVDVRTGSSSGPRSAPASTENGTGVYGGRLFVGPCAPGPAPQASFTIAAVSVPLVRPWSIAVPMNVARFTCSVERSSWPTASSTSATVESRCISTKCSVRSSDGAYQ